MWHYATRNGAQKDVEALRIRLWRPDPSDERPVTRGPWAPEEETRMFKAAKAALSQ